MRIDEMHISRWSEANFTELAILYFHKVNLYFDFAEFAKKKGGIVERITVYAFSLDILFARA